MACLQDRRGFIWFGTKEGLSRFDGFQFKIFLHNSLVSNCLSNNFILSLCEDGDGCIWIGTSEGICFYLPDNDCFGTIESENYKIAGMVIDVKADNKNCIWIATYSGLYRYDKRSKELNFYSSDKYFAPRNISLTNAGDVWLSATDGKIYKYDVRTDSFIGYQILAKKEISASVQLGNILDGGNFGLIVSTNIAGLRQFEPNTGSVKKLFENDRWNNIFIRTTFLNSDEEIWIATETGIYIYNLKTGYITNLHKVGSDPFSISNNAVRTIIKDKEGGLWIGTFYGGANYLAQENKPFEKYYPTGLSGALNGSVVREIRADSYGNIWIGTEDAGLMKFDSQTGLFSSYTDGSTKVIISSRNIQGILVDADDLWIGTYDDGIYILNIPTQKLKSHFEMKDKSSGFKTNSFVTFLKTTDGTIYAGSVIGLYQFIRETSSFRFLNDVAAGTFIHCLFEDSQKNIWIGTYGKGLYKYDRLSGICKKILSERGEL